MSTIPFSGRAPPGSVGSIVEARAHMRDARRLDGRADRAERPDEPAVVVLGFRSGGNAAPGRRSSDRSGDEATEWSCAGPVGSKRGGDGRRHRSPDRSRRMTRVAVLPHRVSTQRCTRPAGGRFESVGSSTTAATSIVDWDRGVPLEVRSEIRVDPDVIRDECGLDPRAPIALIGTWHATATNVRRVGCAVEVDQRSTRTIGFAIDPALAAGTVRLIRTVVLADDHEASRSVGARGAPADLLARASRGGDSLELHSTADTSASRPSICRTCDTVETDAAWLLDVDLSEPDRDASARVCGWWRTSRASRRRSATREPTSGRAATTHRIGVAVGCGAR